MYKYYKEVLSFSDIKVLSNYLKELDFNIDMSDSDIHNFVGNEKVDLLFIKNFLNTKKFTSIKKRYADISNKINYYSKFSEEELLEKFLNCTENNVLSYFDIALVLNELYKKLFSSSTDEFIIKYVFYHDSALCFNIEKLLNDIPTELVHMELKTIINNKFSRYLLQKKNIETFNDIKDVNIELIYLLLLEEIEKFSCFCDTYLYIKNDIADFHAEIKDLFWKPIDMFVIDKRYSIDGYKNTLEDIGNQLNLTRERARQIINNAVLKLKRRKDVFLRIICVLFDVYKTDDNILEIEVLKKYLGEENIKYYLAVLLDKEIYDETLLDYNEAYKVIYYDNKLNEAIDNKLVELDNIIFVKDLKNYTIFERQIVENNYRKKSNYYIKTHVKKSLIYCSIIDELFPHGCKIHDTISVDLINKRYNKIYGENELITDHILGAYVDRENYCMIDWGTFINRKYVPILDEEFKALIKTYIYSCKSVYYTQIYEKFKNKFNEYNIDNQYYVKGIIDDFTQDEFENKKSYIQIKDSILTPVDEIRLFIEAQSTIFSLKQINDMFPGVKNYIIYNVLDSIDNLVLLSKEKFVVIDKIKMDLCDINLIKENIEYLFNNLNSKIISVKKLYSRIKILYNDFFERNNFILDDYSLFSILKIILKDEFYFYRPFIGKEKINSNSSKGVMLNFLEDYNEINVKFIIKYMQKMNMRLLSLDEIFEATSETFVQIDNSTLLKKENLSLNKFELEAIKKYLDLYINNYGVCNISQISSFINLPILKYEWNKYLLLGIVRSYLKDEYRIIQTNKSSNYLNLEFEIRRN